MHPFAPGGSHRGTPRVVVDQLCNRAAECFNVARRNQHAGAAIRYRLDKTAGRIADDGYARRRRFKRRNTQPFRQRRVGEQVEAAEVVIEIVSKARELDNSAEAQRCRLVTQLVVEIALAEQHQP